MAKAGRLFVALDASYYEDDKVLGLSTEAELLFVRGMCMAKRLGTDGVLSCAQVDRINPGEPAAVDELVSADLWEWVDFAYRIRSWSEWHPVEQSSRAWYGNHARWHRDRGIFDPTCYHCRASQQGEPSESSDESQRESLPTSVANRGDESLTEQSRAEQISTRDAKASASGPDQIEIEFNAAWDVYPRKLNRKGALKAYRATRKRIGDEIINGWTAAVFLCKAVQNYAAATKAAGTMPEFMLHGATFFGPNERWRDHLVAGVPVAAPKFEGIKSDDRSIWQVDDEEPLDL